MYLLLCISFMYTIQPCRDSLRGGPLLLEMGGARLTSRWCQSNQNPLCSVICVKTDSHTEQHCAAARAAERLSNCVAE